jgi:hypothetical protein
MMYRKVLLVLLFQEPLLLQRMWARIQITVLGFYFVRRCRSQCFGVRTGTAGTILFVLAEQNRIWIPYNIKCNKRKSKHQK